MSLKKYIEREHNLINSREQNFNSRVSMLYQLDEDYNLSDAQRKKLEKQVEESKELEKELDNDIRITQKYIKSYMLDLLKL